MKKFGYLLSIFTISLTVTSCTPLMQDLEFEGIITADYKVERYQQNIENDEYTLYETETLNGIIGEITSAESKSYEGFSEVSGWEQGVIARDESTVVKIYYNRNIVTVTLTVGDGEDAQTYKIEGKYGAPLDLSSVLEAEPEKEGYTFVGWSSELPETLGENISVTAVFEEIPEPPAPEFASYKVEYYIQNASGVYVLKESITLYGKIGESTAATAKNYGGYAVIETWTQGTVTEDGSTVVKIYYNRIPRPANQPPIVPASLNLSDDVENIPQGRIELDIPSTDTNTYQYSTDDGKTWIPATGTIPVTQDDDTILVRVAPKGTEGNPDYVPPSEPVILDITSDKIGKGEALKTVITFAPYSDFEISVVDNGNGTFSCNAPEGLGDYLWTCDNLSYNEEGLEAHWDLDMYLESSGSPGEYIYYNGPGVYFIECIVITSDNHALSAFAYITVGEPN